MVCPFAQETGRHYVFFLISALFLEQNSRRHADATETSKSPNSMSHDSMTAYIPVSQEKKNTNYGWGIYIFTVLSQSLLSRSRK